MLRIRTLVSRTCFSSLGKSALSPGHLKAWLAVIAGLAMLLALPSTNPVPENQGVSLRQDLSLQNDYFASGSIMVTAGSIKADSNQLRLHAPLDFANGQGISVVNAGPLPGVAPPDALTVLPRGAAGSTHYGYAVAALDGHGGVTAACMSSTATGRAALGSTDYNELETAELPGAAGYAWWRTDGGISYGTGFIGITNGGTALRDTGLPVITPPPGVPVRAPASPLGDLLVTTISSGGGTRFLSLAAKASTTVTGSLVSHDDTAAVQKAINSESVVNFAPGIYPISSTIKVPSNKTICGAGFSSVILATWPLSSGNRWWRNMTMFNLDDSANLTNVTFSNVTLDGGAVLPAREGAKAIDILGSHGADGITVQNCLIYDASDGVTSDTPLSGSCRDVVIKDNILSNITFFALGELRGINSLSIEKNIIYNTGNDSSGQHWDAVYVQGGSNISLTNNEIDLVGDNAIEVGSFDQIGSAGHVPRNVVIADNDLENAYNHGILIDPAVDLLIQGNKIKNTTWNSMTITGGQLNTSNRREVPSGINIKGNLFEHSSSGVGIDFEVLPNYIGSVDPIFIIGNTFKNIRWSAIKLNIHSRGNVSGQTIISDNKAENVYNFVDNLTQSGITVSDNVIKGAISRPIINKTGHAVVTGNSIEQPRGASQGRQAARVPVSPAPTGAVCPGGPC